MAGDFSGDGTVDAADYAAWASRFGGTNGGGTRFDAAAYTMWRDHLGAGAQSTSAATALMPDEPQDAAATQRDVVARSAAFADLFAIESQSSGYRTSRGVRRAVQVPAVDQRSRLADLLAYQQATDVIFNAIAEDDFDARLRRRPESRDRVKSNVATEFSSLDQPLADLARGERLV